MITPGWAGRRSSKQIPSPFGPVQSVTRHFSGAVHVRLPRQRSVCEKTGGRQARRVSRACRPPHLARKTTGRPHAGTARGAARSHPARHSEDRIGSDQSNAAYDRSHRRRALRRSQSSRRCQAPGASSWSALRGDCVANGETKTSARETLADEGLSSRDTKAADPGGSVPERHCEVALRCSHGR